MNSLRFCISLIIIFSIGTGQLKNLQVLDFKSERDLKKYMKTIGKSLGVKCKFCHDINDKSIDTDHKLVAREMMQMQIDLNKSFFAQIGDSLLHRETTLQISCWTCHRGSNEPQLIRSKEK